MEEKKRIIWIDYAKAITIIMVIVGHAIAEFSLKYKWLEVMIYSIHIPLFFILSGYTFKVKSDTKGWIIKRIKRIMLPYLLFCFCITACHTLEILVLKQESDFWIKLLSKNRGGVYTYLTDYA